MFIAIYQWMQNPATNKGVSVIPEDQNVLSSNVSLLPFDTTFFFTNVPSYLQSKSITENPDAPTSGMYLFKHQQISLNDQLAINTGTLSGSTLNELSTIKVRQSEPSRYHQTSRPSAPEGAIVFERQDQYEVAVFWQHNGRYASVVVGGSNDRRADLESTLQTVLSDWQWR